MVVERTRAVKSVAVVNYFLREEGIEILAKKQTCAAQGKVRYGRKEPGR